MPEALFTTQEPSAAQHAPVGIIVQAPAPHAVPAAVNVLGRAQAVAAVKVQEPFSAQHAPTLAEQGSGEHEEPKPWNRFVPVQLAAITLAVQTPRLEQHAPRNGLQIVVGEQAVPSPRNVFAPLQPDWAVSEQDPVPLQHAPAQALGVHAPLGMKIRLPVQPVVVAVQVVPLQQAPV